MVGNPSPSDRDVEVWFSAFPVRELPRSLARAPGVVAIIVLSFVVVALGRVMPDITGAMEARSAALADAQLWRLVTYVFPHEGGWPHVTVNMFTLALYGWQLERIVGTVRFLVLYLGAGALGMALLSALNPINADTGIRTGASLAVFGTVAAIATCYVITNGWHHPSTRWAAAACGWLCTIAGLLAIGGVNDVIDPGIDGFLFSFRNHALGVVAGALLGVVVAPRVPTVRRVLVGLGALGLGAAALVVGASRWT